MALDEVTRRFWRYVGVTPAPPGIDGLCWVWTGARNKSGVPVWWHDGAQRYPHVWAWEQEKGPKPAGMQLSPRCERSVCVRPLHRELRRRGQHRMEGRA